MRNKAPLALMEQLVMVLVFALAAALCIQVFVFSDQTSRRNEERDRAVLVAQNAAETLKAADGDMAHAQETAAKELGGKVSQGLLYVCYDENWNVVDESRVCYWLEAQGVPTPVEGLWQANVWVVTEEDARSTGEPLFSLPVAWQEVNGNG